MLKALILIFNYTQLMFIYISDIGVKFILVQRRLNLMIQLIALMVTVANSSQMVQLLKARNMLLKGDGITN